MPLVPYVLIIVPPKAKAPGLHHHEAENTVEMTSNGMCDYEIASSSEGESDFGETIKGTWGIGDDNSSDSDYEYEPEEIEDNNAETKDKDTELPQYEDDEGSPVPNWARYIWRMMVLYWLAVAEDMREQAWEYEDRFRSYGIKKGLDLRFFLLRTQDVKFQLANNAFGDELSVDRKTGALSAREVEDKFILELLGEHIELIRREDLRRRLGLSEWRVILNDWEAIVENRGIVEYEQHRRRALKRKGLL
ncbi:hypothetical protein RUND412_003035 [Rhizina undulata]